MNDEPSYHFGEGRLTVCEPSLHIMYDDLFSPELLPEYPEERLGIKIHRDTNGFMREAWIEKNGLQEGQWRRYDREMHVIGEGYHLHGQLHGPMVFRTSKGGLLAETWFIKGKRQGRGYFFYPNGRIYAVMRYLDGEKHGPQEYFYLDGETKAILYYAEGKVSKHPDWFPEKDS
jgi:antitoxin component YwqK of YwqJK toxin-antitoxin module